MSNSETDQIHPVAALVPEAQRMHFLPALFGKSHFLIGERTVYDMMRWLSPHDYRGGGWDFFELDGRPLYLVPPALQRYRIVCDTNGFSGSVSTDAAGIIGTLFALSHLSFTVDSDLVPEAYACLYAYALGHPEAREIFNAID